MSIEAEDTDHKIEIEDILMAILDQLQIMNAHLSHITNLDISKEDVK